MATKRFDQRPSGIELASELPWGSHFGIFYASKHELLDAVVPFIRAGLLHNELCSWEICPPLTVDEARRALAEGIPNFAVYVGREQIELVARPAGAAQTPSADNDAVIKRLDRAVLAGFDGLRLVHHPGVDARRPGRASRVGDLAGLSIVAAYAYPRADIGALGLMELVKDHRFALVCNAGRWELLEGSEARLVSDALERSEERLQSLFENMSEGFAYHRIILDARGRPCDYVFLEVSDAFERLTGLAAARTLGKRVTQVMPGIENDPADWIGTYGQVALTGQPIRFESYAAALDRWFAVSAFSSHKGYFACTFADITARKQAEAERREAEERLLVTLRSIGDAVISTDTEGRAVILNRVAEELTGYTQAEAAGRSLREVFNIISEETGEPAADPVRKVIEKGTVIGLANHTALVRRDGRRISIADSAAPVRSNSGELVGVVLVFRDVSEARQAERKLEMEKTELALANRILEVFAQESGTTLFATVMQIISEGTGSRGGLFGYVSERGDLVCPAMPAGRPGGTSRGGAPMCVTFPRGTVSGPWGRALVEQRTLVTNERVHVTTGHPALESTLAVPILFQEQAIGVWCLANKAGGYDDADRELVEAIARRVAPVLYAWIQKDLREKERIASERALRASEARFKLLSDTASLLLTTENPQGVVTKLCSEVMAHLDCQAFFNFLVDEGAGCMHLNAYAGISESEAKKIEWLDFGVAVCGCAARDRKRITVGDIQATADPRADLVRSYGIQAYCAHPLLAQGRLLGTLSFGTTTRPRFSDEDVALMKTVADQVAVAMERIQAQEALRSANSRLVESDQRKNEFLAVLSHELRNPLAPIKNSLYILEHTAPADERAVRAKAVISRQVTHLAHLVDDLLDLTRISRNKIHLQRERIDLCEVVRRCAEDQRSLFERSEIRLEQALSPEPLMAWADATRTAQVVGNLLQNAVKFTGRGGVVRLAVSADRPRAEAVIKVTDSGVGMTATTLGGLFRPFMQADTTLDRSMGGLGLGLALVKGLVELHGGEVSAHSDGLGKGSEFIVRLPLQVGPTPTQAAPAAPSVQGGRRVLIIEDNLDAAETLREALELNGHRIEVAYNGPEGLEKARAFRPEVVLCDIGLPGMDGFAVARAFRNDAALEETTLVALSGYALPEDLQRAAEAGFERHLAKPLNLATLEELLARIPAPRR